MFVHMLTFYSLYEPLFKEQGQINFFISVEEKISFEFVSGMVSVCGKNLRGWDNNNMGAV